MQMEQDWSVALEIIKKHTFKILTPRGSGTGFLLTKRAGDVCGIATALHVIDHANQWEEPIKLINAASKSEVILHQSERFIFPNTKTDCALILFQRGSLKTEDEPPPLAPKDKALKPGLQIGWAGYPAVAPNEFCFFTGNISCFLAEFGSYLVDGVAINGVSGGPAFVTFEKWHLVVIGIVSAYIPSRAGGETLPGVCFITGIYPFHDFIKGIVSLEQARDKALKEATNKKDKLDNGEKPAIDSP
jgi:hypothetical protein